MVREDLPMDGVEFGRYRLVSMLGEGGMGQVWRARDTVIDRVVALKLLPVHLSEDHTFRQRFRREAHAAARLETPHAVPIYDYGEIDGRLFVSMRLIKGRDLATVLVRGPLVPARAVHVVAQVAEALHAAHENGLIHRDIKPSNILLDDRDFAYLIDFGIARVADDTRLTKSGNTIGSFAYIAPERLDSRAEEDARTDIYSLACVLYESLTGEPPFAGTTTAHLVAAHLTTPPPRPSKSRPAVPPAIDAVIATGMAKVPDQRYATTIELADAARDAITMPLAPPAPAFLADRPRPGPGRRNDQEPPRPAPAPQQVWQQHAFLHSPAPQQRPPGGSPDPHPANRPLPQIATSEPPRARRPRRRLRWPLIAAIAVILAAAGITGRLLWPNPAPSRTSAAQAGSASGQTPRPAPSSGQTALPFTGLTSPQGVAVDAAGNVYVADRDSNQVLMLPAGSSTQAVLPFSGLNSPTGVAVDKAGNVYVADSYNGRVLKLDAKSRTPAALPFTGLKNPSYLVVDAAGSLYLADNRNSRVLKLTAGASTPSVLPFTDLYRPIGVAVDGAGNVYVTDNRSDQVLKLAASGSTQSVLPFAGLNHPIGVAADHAGNVYVADGANSRVWRLAAGSTTPTLLPFTVSGPFGLALDGANNLYVADFYNRRVIKLAAR